MKRMWNLVLAFGLVSASLMATDKPTFVLVHGALFTSAGWARTQSLLQDAGYNTVTLDVPGRLGDGVDPKSLDIQKAGEKVCQLIALQKGDVILVGHSQGGAVITQGYSDCPDKKVKALVFVAAVAPKDAEIAFAALDPKLDTGFGKCAAPDTTSGLFKLIPGAPLAETFLQDADDETKVRTAASMVPEPIGIGTTPLKLSEEKLAEMPRFYIETLSDRVVSIESQRKIQKRLSWKKIYSMETGHCPFLSKPEEFTKNLVEIAEFL